MTEPTPPGYTEQEWHDKNPTYPLSALRMKHIEDGVAAEEAFIKAVEEWATPKSVVMTGAAAADVLAYQPTTFNGVVDPIWKIGYNADLSTAGESAFFYGIEGNYCTPAESTGIWFKDGAEHNVHETYVEFNSSTRAVDFRPFYVGVLRDSGTSHAACVQFDIGTESFPKSQFLIKAGASTVVNVTSGGLFVTGKIEVGGKKVQVPQQLSAHYSPPFAITSTTTKTALTGYWTSIRVADETPMKGISFGNGGTVAGNVLVALFNSAGEQVAHSASTAQAGTFTAQFVPFTAEYTPVPGVYYVWIMPELSTATFGCARILGGGASKAEGSFTIPSTVTPPAVNATVEMPILSTY
jgi:hypothetical protein